MSDLKTITLIAKSDCLWVDDDDDDNILLYYTPTTYKYTSDGDRYVDKMGGDVDTIQWPNPDKGKLRTVLRDEIEIGAIPDDTQFARLPDGALFPL